MSTLKPLLFLCASAFSVTACADVSGTDALTRLLTTVSDRLSIADQVALSKWDSGKPIQDSPREAQVIAAATQLASTYKLEPQDVSQLLAAQIEANKLVQYALLAKWREAGDAPDSPRPDLVGQIRPQLDLLQRRLLADYAAFAPWRKDPQCATWLSEESLRLARDPIHDLALIRATGELCITAKQLPSS